jgi:hypothetical protein
MSIQDGESALYEYGERTEIQKVYHSLKLFDILQHL